MHVLRTYCLGKPCERYSSCTNARFTWNLQTKKFLTDNPLTTVCVVVGVRLRLNACASVYGCKKGFGYGT